jgi:hypothetical protein
VQLLLALPRPATLGRRCRGRHAAEGARRGTVTAPSICGWPRAYSLPLYRTTPLYKTLTETSLAHLPFLLPHERQAERRAVHRNSSPPRPTPSQFQRPKASSPPLLAPRPTLAELCPLLNRNRVNPVPPLPLEKPEPPPHRRPPSAPPPAEIGTEIASPQLHDARARSILQRSSAPRREHGRTATAAAIPRRRPCSAALPCAHHLPTCAPHSVDGIGPVCPSPKPRRRREHTGQAATAAIWAWQGPHCNLSFNSRVPYAKPEGLSASFSFSLVCKSCQIIKLIEICRKIQKLSNQFCYTPEV